jgi:molybdopterin synthase sulfur carrier subunit
MPNVVFTPALQRHVPCPPASVEGATVREVLDRVFGENPRARTYVLDEQGALRKHMMVFIDGEAVQDRNALSDGVGADSQIYVMQALSGG